MFLTRDAKNITQQLADFAMETTYEDLPEKVVREAKRVLLDSIGCALAGMATNKGRISTDMAKRLGGKPESSVIGTDQKVSCANAAFANGELINALDFDAALRPALHVAPFVLPPALALGESRSCSGKDLVLATVLGHEITSRVASGLSRGSRFLIDGVGGSRVVQPAVYGYSTNVFGAAASAGKILKLDRVKMVNAFGIAGYNAPMQTSGQWHHSGTDCLVKFASAGWIAQAGLTAALLAEMGYTGDVSVLDGEYSFWKFSGSEYWRPEVVVRDFGRQWHILNTRYKPYPCCGIIVTPLDLFNSVMAKSKLKPEEMEQVKVWLSPTSEMPLWQNRHIENEIHAQFSVAYAFAMAAYGISKGVEWQDPTNWESRKIKEFMSKVSATVHPEYRKTRTEPATSRIARVDIVAKGRTYSEEGGASDESEFKDSDLEKKFRHNASGVLSEHRTGEVVKYLWDLDEIHDISSLLGILSSDEPRKGRSGR